MLITSDSTVFNVGADCIVNTVNCVSVMGKGLALEFALRYPKLEEIYIKQCRNKEINTGKVYFYQINGQKIINFPTKFHYAYPSKMEWVIDGLDYFVKNYKSFNIKSVAFPLLGASNGQLNPKEVEKIMIEKLSNLDIDVYICKSKKVEGKELEMINNFKNTSIEVLSNSIKLESKQIDALLLLQKSIKRFSDILDIKDIGKATYKKLFRYFYDGRESEQLSLFEL